MIATLPGLLGSAQVVIVLSQVRTARLDVIQAGLPYVDFTETITKDTFVEQMDRTRATRQEDLDYWGRCAKRIRLPASRSSEAESRRACRALVPSSWP